MRSAIFGDGRRTATVTTTPMFGSEFRQLQRDHPEIERQLEAATAARRTR